MKGAIRERVVQQEPGLYIYIVFPMVTAFLLTFLGARLLSNLAPQVYLLWFGIHVHHFAYGFFVLIAVGYLALVFSGPRAKYLIALLHGFGMGLAFDEFGMWIHLSEEEPIRWSYNGFLLVVGALLTVITAKPGLQMLKKHLPFRRYDDIPKT